jgi:hypothetical protein
LIHQNTELGVEGEKKIRAWLTQVEKNRYRYRLRK